MSITETLLTENRAKLARVKEQHLANLHATEGALQVIDQLLAHLATPPPVPDQPPEDES